MDGETSEAGPGGWRGRLDRLARGLERALDALLAAMLTLLVGSLVWQVFGRYALDAAPGWSEELARFLMVWIAMLGSAVVMRENGHIGVAVLVERLPTAARAVLLAVRDAVVLFVVYVLVAYGLDLARLLSVRLSAAFEVSMALPYAALPVGAALIGLMAVVARLTGSAYARGAATTFT